MKLTPHQILQKLGFDVPVDGIDIAPTDAFLCDTVLRLAGRSINLATVADAEFEVLHAGMTGFAMQRGQPVVPTDAHAVTATLLMAKTVLEQIFKLPAS